MFIINTIQSTENQERKKTFIEELCFEDFIVNFYTEEEIEEFSSQTDVFFLEEEMLQNMAQVCQLILAFREHSKAYILVKQSQQNPDIRSLYFQIGANAVIDDSYKVKEVACFLKNTLQKENQSSVNSLSLNVNGQHSVNIELNEGAQSVKIGEKEIHLTRKEFGLMRLLVNKKGAFLTREEIHQNIWSDKKIFNPMDVNNLVFRLRIKIEKGSEKAHYIQSVHGRGYSLSV